MKKLPIAQNAFSEVMEIIKPYDLENRYHILRYLINMLESENADIFRELKKDGVF